MNRAPHIGMTGPAGAGKSTAADWFIDTFRHRAFLFAAPMKAALVAMIDSARPKANPHPGAWYVNNPEGKQTPMDFMGDVTARHLMQTLGTEWGRNTISKDFWVRIAAARLNRSLGTPQGRNLRYVFEDVRFDNEADLIRALGGTILRIERPGHTHLSASEAAHTSETEPPEADIVIVNDGTKEDLHARLAQHFPPPADKTRKT